MSGFPSKHETLTERCVNVGSSSTTRININPALAQSLLFAGLGEWNMFPVAHSRTGEIIWRKQYFLLNWIYHIILSYTSSQVEFFLLLCLQINGNFQPLEVVDRGSETQPQVVENLSRHTIRECFKPFQYGFRDNSDSTGGLLSILFIRADPEGGKRTSGQSRIHQDRGAY